MISKSYKLQQLASMLGANLIGDPDCEITGIAALDKDASGKITFLENPHYKKFLAVTNAACVLIKDEYRDEVKTNALIVKDPYVAYAKISMLFDDTPPAEPGIHASVVLGKECIIDPTVSIAPYCVIGNKVKIEKNVRIEPGSFIGDETEIAEGTRICARVVLYHKTKIGKRVLIHSGAVIGSDGFGNANENGVWRKIYQLGRVVIGNDVEIGANTTIDRGAIEDTIIEDGVRLDNQIQIGHNVKVGAHTAIAGCVGIAGSTKIGRHCMIGGGAGISGHIEIADGVIITAMSGVGKSITEPGIYASGLPAMPHRNWWRILARMMNIEQFVKRLTVLEEKCK